MPNSPIRSAFAPMKPSVPLPQKPPETPGESGRDDNARQQPNLATKANRSPPKPTALYDVAVTLQLVAELPKGEPVMVRSKLGAAGERMIALSLNAGHILVSRSLKRADTLLIRFLLCMALAEYIGFWRGRHDGQALRDAITELSAIEPEKFLGIALASKLAASELLRVLDRTPIFVPAPSAETFELFRVKAVLQVESEISNWRPKHPRKEADV